MRKTLLIAAASLMVGLSVTGCSIFKPFPPPDRGYIPNVDQPINPGLTNEWGRTNNSTN